MVGDKVTRDEKPRLDVAGCWVSKCCGLWTLQGRWQIRGIVGRAEEPSGKCRKRGLRADRASREMGCTDRHLLMHQCDVFQASLGRKGSLASTDSLLGGSLRMKKQFVIQRTWGEVWTLEGKTAFFKVEGEGAAAWVLCSQHLSHLSKQQEGVQVWPLTAGIPAGALLG